MSAVTEGGRIQNEAMRMQEQAEVGVQTNAQNVQVAGDTGAQGGARAAQFPRKFSARSDRDDLVRMKMEMMDEDGMTPFGQVQFTERDARWLMEKQKAQEAANFDKWFGANFHTNDVAGRAVAQELYPRYYEERERHMTERAKLALRIKLMELRGPKSEEDLLVLYGLQSGILQLDDGWDKIGFNFEDSNMNDPRNGFKRGLLSLRRLFATNDNRLQNARVDAPFGNPEYTRPNDLRANVPAEYGGNQTWTTGMLNNLLG